MRRLTRWGLFLSLPVFITFLAGGTAGSPRGLTFGQRVAAQAAIERVYHAHRIGSSRTFEEAVPVSLLERKVRTYLKESVALDELWGTPLTSEALRRELGRIDSHTQLPDRLLEIRAALGDDESLMLETLVRAELADRLVRRFMGRDERVQRAPRAAAERIRLALASGALDPHEPHPLRVRTEAAPAGPGRVGPVVEREDAFEVFTALEVDESGGRRGAVYRVAKVTWEQWWAEAAPRFDEARFTQPVMAGGISLPANRVTAPPPAASSVVPDIWGAGSEEDVPQGRFEHTAVWTGSEMIVWGGAFTNNGARYDPITDEWHRISTTNAPAARLCHVAVWTGNEMVVWGGDTGGFFTTTGGRYDPATDTWKPTSTVGTPSARIDATAVWTGTRMIVWGGSNGGAPLDTGGRYNPATDAWEPTSFLGAPSARQEHTAVWTGSRMIVWGGSFTNTGGLYDPVADSWRPTSTADAPTGREAHTAVWTGTEMIVWGSFFSGFEATGGRYDPATDQWAPTPLAGAPTNRYHHSAVWTGTHMIVWGGTDSSHSPPNPNQATGSRYDPVSNSWSDTTTLNAPSARAGHTAVWTGTEMIIWGGDLETNTGGRYDPAANSWTPTDVSRRALEPRAGHSLVWTGTEMIVWGGEGQSGALANGSRYDAITDTWSATSMSNAPIGRVFHSTIWTGSEMIVWGGDPGSFVYTDTGGRYDPMADLWLATPTAGAPTPRGFHTAVWTGSEMIVWGGIGGGSIKDSGARFSPATNTWTPISSAAAPSARYLHTAVWTSSEMIVWGGGSSNPENSGGRYDPADDQWSPTPLALAPAARSGHTATWTGTEMIVWGGFDDGAFELRSGGRLDPASNSWTPTHESTAPQARGLHTAVWTGEEMIVWGGFFCIDPPIICADLDTGGRYDPIADAWSQTTTTNAPRERYGHGAVWTGGAMLVWGGTDITVDVVRLVDDRWVPWYGSLAPMPSDGDGDGVPAPADCDDTDPLVHPGAVELPGNPIDENCDGQLSCDPGMLWRNRGEFMRCVARTCGRLVDADLLAPQRCGELVRQAAQSQVVLQKREKQARPPQEP